MRITYPLLWSRPDREACREQTMNTVAALARRGHELTLLMPRRRGDPELRPDDLRAWFDVEGEFRLVQRHTAWTGPSALASSLWLRQVFRDVEVRRSQILLARIPALLAFGRSSPVPFAVDHYRPWPDDLPLLRPAIRRTTASRKCLGLILHSDYAAQSYRRIGVAEDKILVAHNGAEPRRMGHALSQEDARAAIGLSGGRPIAVYAGRLNPRKGLDAVLALAARRPDVLFLLVGSEGRGPVETEAAALANVTIFPWQEPAALAPFLHAADVLIIPPSAAPLEVHRTCVLPLKLFSYLAAGRPILAPRSPDTAELLEDGETALLVEPGDADRAAGALDRIMADPALRERLGANAQALSADLTWDSRARRIEAFLQERLECAG